MKIKDKAVFLPHKQTLIIDVYGIKEKIGISLNMNVDTYYSISCYLSDFEETRNVDDIVEAATAILHYANRKFDKKFVVKNLSIENQMKIIEQTIGGMSKLLSAEYLQIPNIQVQEKPTTSKFEKERAEKKKKIKSANELLAKKQEDSLIEDITLVMMKTGNTYNDIMNMPILFFKNLVKQIVINEMRTDEDYNLAYLQYELNEYRKELNSGEAVISTSPKGANLKELKQFFG